MWSVFHLSLFKACPSILRGCNYVVPFIPEGLMWGSLYSPLKDSHLQSEMWERGDTAAHAGREQ